MAEAAHDAPTDAGEVDATTEPAPLTPRAIAARDAHLARTQDRSDYTVIDTRDGFLKAVSEIAAGTGPVAVDAERASGFTYSQRAYLIQLYRRGAGVYLFDPPAIGRLDELQDVIRDVEWILHAASQDLTCLREVGLDPTRIFDSELGARLLGFARVGLGAVVEQLLGIHLAKEHSAADWSTRPLPQSWLTYAALDVELLVDVRDEMVELLEEEGKAEIAAEEFEAVLAKDLKPVRTDPWRRLSGIHSLRGIRSLAIARDLWLARDALAQERDVSPGRLIPDSSILAIAKNPPASQRDMQTRRDFTGRASRPEIDRWWAALQSGRTTSDLPVIRAAGETLPPPRSWADRNPDADRRLKVARIALTAVSEERRIPLENLLTPEVLRRLAWSPPGVVDVPSISEALADLGARPWQRELTAPLIVASFVEANQTSDEAPEETS